MSDMEGIKLTVEEFTQKVKESIEEDEEGFYNRVEEMRRVVFDHDKDPINFVIMGDAFLSFYVFPKEVEILWLKGSLEDRRQIIYEMMDFEDIDVIIKRIMYMTDMLKFTSIKKDNPIYEITMSWLFYVLSGFEGFLTEMAMSYYSIPPMYKEKDIKVPEQKHEGMYQ